MTAEGYKTFINGSVMASFMEGIVASILEEKSGAGYGTNCSQLNSELSNVLQDADYANASEFYTELFMVREERQRYEEACKEWQQKCVEVELVAVKDSKYFGDVISISRNRGR